MKKQWRWFGPVGVTALAVFLAGAKPCEGSPQQSQQLQSKSKVKTSEQERQEEGEKKFKQNCSRCHNAPEDFSSRISDTVVRHMRVRASLSKKDAEAILRFLNP